MSRKITIATTAAFVAAKPLTMGNTSVIVKDGTVALYLFGNLIAEKIIESDKLMVTNAGWFSPTTKERLNGIPGVSVNQVAGKWYLNGVQWDGKFQIIK